VTLERFFSRVVPALESASVPYMLTGSVANSLHGTPRSTRDLDVVIDPSGEQLTALVKQLLEMDFFAVWIKPLGLEAEWQSARSRAIGSQG
jgi:hypothetical protein